MNQKVGSIHVLNVLINGVKVKLIHDNFLKEKYRHGYKYKMYWVYTNPSYIILEWGGEKHV